MKQDISDSEIKQLVTLLQKLELGFLPYDVFAEIARLVVMPIIEFVPLRINQVGEVEILLLSRGADDPIWPSEVHVPGTVIRATDTDGEMYMALERIVKDELQNTKVSNPQYVGSNLHASKRGVEQAQIFWVEVLGAPNAGNFYSATSLPDNLIESQRNFINQAIQNFKKAKELA